MEHRIVTNLWFDGNAEEAAEFYCSIFKSSRVVNRLPYPESSDHAGTDVTVEWELDGHRFVGINGGPMFKFNEAVSLQINCEDQAEVDYYWDRLTEGGEELPCGWLKDRFGLAWQVTPTGMDELFSDPDRDRANRAWEAMMKMKKLDVEALRAAADGERQTV